MGRSKYSPELKKAVLDAINEYGMPQVVAAEKYKVSHKRVSEWLNAAIKCGETYVLEGGPVQTPESERLQEEIDQDKLRAEARRLIYRGNRLLEKAAALQPIIDEKRGLTR